MSEVILARINITTNQSELMEQIEIDSTWNDSSLSRAVTWMEIQEAVERAINRSKEELENV